MKCTHTKRNDTWIDVFVNDWGHVVESHWNYDVIETYKDVDLHRYKCTQCNEIFYYSGRAREYYEKGTKFEGINGLDK